MAAANGLFAGGGLIGCIIVPWVSDKLGRIRAMQIACALIVVSAAMQSASVHIGMFLVGRFICGVGCVCSYD
jgi:MFS family permease